MRHSNSNTSDSDGLLEEPFLSIFDQSLIPMALLDRDRRYLKVNDALVNFYEHPRSELVGAVAGRGDPMVVEGEGIDDRWEQFVRANELYGERVVEHASGSRLQVSFAAHGMTVGRRWLALVVALSARPHAGGPEMIGSVPLEAPNGAESKLTVREREVVRLVALGSTTRQVAVDLCLSPDTIRSHVRNAMAKTGAHTRAQLVAQVLADRVVAGSEGNGTGGAL
ncbi:MAG TPA: helix-turn-helix transcriptional regulator [Solirubrobacteraceae bacterium]|jgi:DNA-binding CsgD family transcriptional regulator